MTQRTRTVALCQPRDLHRSACVSIRQHTPAYVSIRQHMSAYVSIRQHTWQHLVTVNHDSMLPRMLAQYAYSMLTNHIGLAFKEYRGIKHFTTDFTIDFTTDFTTSNTCVVSSQWTTTVCLHSTSALLSKRRGASSTTTLYRGFS
jgi:hypothetical protein